MTAEADGEAEPPAGPGEPMPSWTPRPRLPARRSVAAGVAVAAAARRTAGEGDEAPPPRAPQPQPQPQQRYMGPTPADPFAGHVDDILAAMEAAEAAAEAAATASRRARAAIQARHRRSWSRRSW